MGIIETIKMITRQETIEEGKINFVKTQKLLHSVRLKRQR